MTRSSLSASRVRELFVYDEQTGVFVRLVRTSDSTHEGDVAGFVVKSGYRSISVDGYAYREHRLAWLYVHGAWPEGDIDHINGNRADNRICNLRDVTRSTNMENQRVARSNSRSGALGVSWDASREKWCAQLFARGRHVFRKRFDKKQDAIDAYIDAKRKWHEGCTL